MKHFACNCGNRVFFDNTACLACGSTLGFDPRTQMIHSIEANGDGTWRSATPASIGGQFRLCRNQVDHDVCNWLVGDDEHEVFCLSCRMNRTIPNLSGPSNLKRWAALEAAKRRMIYLLLRLSLPVSAADQDPQGRLSFKFLEDQRSNPNVMDSHVLTGYGDSVITINIAEADDVYRENVRMEMNEAYRTLLGHFRHESGHYYWQRLILPHGLVGEFRDIFGDETQDYAQALEHYHATEVGKGWSEHYISAYAKSHPSEDWAECWAHYMHMADTLETAEVNGVLRGRGLAAEFDGWLDEWMRLSVILNELNHSMGLRDAYPFVLSQPVVNKLRFVHKVISFGARSTRHAAIP